MHSEVVRVSLGVRVLMVGDVRDGKEIMREEHPGGDPCTEFLDLVMDVMEEGITGPVAYQHDGENQHPARYIAMVAPDHIEWVPMLPIG